MGNRSTPRPLRYLFLFLLLGASVTIIGSRIPLSYLKEAGSSSLQVLIEYRGAFEREIERIITIPLESALAEIRGVEEIYSLSEPGQSRIHILLSEGTSLQDAYLETREVIDRIYRQFPPVVQRPLILRSDPRKDPVFIAAFPLESGESEESLKRRFQSIEGVGEVEVGGGRKEELLIRWIPDKGFPTGISFPEIGSAIRAWNVSGGFGDATGVSQNLLRLIDNPEGVEKVPLRRILTVGDIAEVMRREIPRERRARVNGEELLVLYVRPEGDGNLLRLSQTLTSVTRSIPGSSILYDRGAKMKSSLDELFLALGIGAAGVVLLTGIFLHTLLPALLVSLSIPFSTFSALAVLHLLGKTLDVVSLSALTVGAGLVIDSGVILADRFLEQKGTPIQTVLSEVKDPILLSTLTTMGVFLPLLFASPQVRLQFEPLALTLVFQLAASLLYTLVFLPVFLAASFRPHAPANSKSPATPPTPPTPSASSLPLSSPRWFSHRFRTPPRLAILFGFLLLLGGGVYLLLQLPRGREGLEDASQLDFLLEFESGVPLEQVINYTEPLERFLSHYPGVAQVRVKYERERATFSLELSAPRKTLVQEICNRASSIPHSFLFLGDSARGGGSLSVVLCGEGSLEDTAVAFAFHLQQAAYLTKEVHRTKEVDRKGSDYGRKIPSHSGPLEGKNSRGLDIIFHFKEPLPSKRIILDPQRIGRFGLTPKEVRDYLYTSLSEPVIDKSITSQGETDIRLSFPYRFFRGSADLLSLSLPGTGGPGVRVSDVGSLVEKQSPRRLYRTNRRRSASFTVLTEFQDPSFLIPRLRKAAEEYPFPEGVTVEIGKEWEEEAVKYRQYLGLLLLSLGVLLLILLGFYQEVISPLLVILQLPFSLAFSVWALWIFQIPLTLSIATGFFLSFGTGVNNSLLVFPRRRNAVSPLERFRLSFRSMLTATLTTVVGILPLWFRGGGVGGSFGLSESFAGLSLVLGAGSIGSLIVLWGVVTLLEPKNPMNRKSGLFEQPKGRHQRQHPPGLSSPPGQASLPGGGG